MRVPGDTKQHHARCPHCHVLAERLLFVEEARDQNYVLLDSAIRKLVEQGEVLAQELDDARAEIRRLTSDRNRLAAMLSKANDDLAGLRAAVTDQIRTQGLDDMKHDRRPK